MTAAWRRVTVWGVLAAVLAAALAYGFWPGSLPVDLVTVGRGPLVVTIDEEAETRVRDVFVLSAPVTGRALRIGVDPGDRVVAGETIVARIEPIDPAFLDARTVAQARADVDAAEAAMTLAEAELGEARAALNFATLELERARRLVRSDTIAQRALDQAELEFEVRSAAVATAEASVRMRQSELIRAQAELVSPAETRSDGAACDCVPIRAPVSGSVLRVFHESEGVVEAGETLIEIGDPRDLEIVADLLSSDAVKVQPGQRVMIEDWGGDRTLDGRVRLVEPYGFTKVSALGIEEQRVNVIMDFTEPPDRWQRLGHGFRVEIRIVQWEGDDVLTVPLTALFRDGTRWAVFLMQDGRAMFRHVEVGQRTGFDAEILDGLAEGDQVVLYPSDRVADGVRIVSRD
ncbi:MAG: efflux RND transporter periplasmic adaptor subunit [Inquilinaceae bacterium]